jgi:hypothetical protein
VRHSSRRIERSGGVEGCIGTWREEEIYHVAGLGRKTKEISYCLSCPGNLRVLFSGFLTMKQAILNSDHYLAMASLVLAAKEQLLVR